MTEPDEAPTGDIPVIPVNPDTDPDEFPGSPWTRIRDVPLHPATGHVFLVLLALLLTCILGFVMGYTR